jgi:hypothetical protein
VKLEYRELPAGSSQDFDIENLEPEELAVKLDEASGKRLSVNNNATICANVCMVGGVDRAA